MIGDLIKSSGLESCNEDLKLVKGASLFSKNGIVYIKHYQTIIFAYDSKKGLTEADFDCSQTSNRQIRFALNHFGIPQASVINTHDGSKWNYSGDRY